MLIQGAFTLRHATPVILFSMSEVSGKTRDCLDSIGVDLVGEVVPPRDHAGPHFCLRCTMPIAIYGRLSPCNHLYCHACAKTVKTCTFCHKNVVRVQLLENVDMFVCPYVARDVSEEGGCGRSRYRGWRGRCGGRGAYSASRGGRRGMLAGGRVVGWAT